MNLLPVAHARDITTAFHVQKRVGKDFNQECSQKMFKAIAAGEYSATCNLSKADMDILKNLQYTTQEFKDECLADGRMACIVSWKPAEFHK